MKRETGIAVSVTVAIMATAGQAVTIPGDMTGQAVGALGSWPYHVAMALTAIIAVIVAYKLAVISITRAGELTKETNQVHRQVGKQVSEHYDAVERYLASASARIDRLVASVQALADIMGMRCKSCPELEKERAREHEETSG